VVHRRNLDFGLEHPKASFNIGKSLVALHHFWRRQVMSLTAVMEPPMFGVMEPQTGE
jgi:hypothetical protein